MLAYYASIICRHIPLPRGWVARSPILEAGCGILGAVPILGYSRFQQVMEILVSCSMRQILSFLFRPVLVKVG